jgi:hypothetical protein
MPEDGKLFRPFLRPHRIESDLKGHPGGLALITGNPSCVDTHVTGCAIFIRLGMTDIAARFIPVNCMCFSILRVTVIDLLMAIYAHRTIINSVSIFVFLVTAMHLRTGMALLTFHKFFVMNIRLHVLVLAEIFLSDSAAVTCSANQFHGRLSLKEMPFKEPAINRVRSADMTLPAAAMARAAVILEDFIHFFPNCLIGARPLVERRFKRLQGNVKALSVILYYVIVTITADLPCIGIGRVFNHALVCGFPIGIPRVASMAGVTLDISVVFILKNVTVYEDLFMRGQRLHLTASSLTLIGRFNYRPCFGDLPGYFNQRACICMAFEALACRYLGAEGFALHEKQTG